MLYYIIVYTILYISIMRTCCKLCLNFEFNLLFLFSRSRFVLCIIYTTLCPFRCVSFCVSNKQNICSLNHKFELKFDMKHPKYKTPLHFYYYYHYYNYCKSDA